MTIPIREQRDTGVVGGANPISFTLGAGTATTDLLVVIACDDYYTLANFPSTPGGSAASVWSTRLTIDGGTNDNHARVWTAPVTTPGAQTVTVGWGASSDHEKYVGIWVLQDSPEFDVADGTETDATSTSHVAPSLNPSSGKTDDLMICFWGTEPGGQANYSVPGSMTAYTEYDCSGSATYRAAREQLASDSATGTRTATGVSPAWAGIALSVLIKSATAGALPPPAFDATSGDDVLTTTATTATWTHTPVGTPRGVVVLIPQGVNTDQISAVSYGGVALDRIRLDARATAETCASYIYFLGKNIPTGAQTVSVTSTGINPKWPQVITVTASGDTEIDAQAGGDQGIIANPSQALTPTAPAVVVYVNASGLNTPVSTPETNTTQAAARDLGTISGHIGYKAVAAAGATTIGWTSASDDVCHSAVSIIETISKAPKSFIGASIAAQRRSRW